MSEEAAVRSRRACLPAPKPPAVMDLVARAGALARAPRRAVLGITGPPGAGKSTLAQSLVTALGASAALVPLDGFHLADSELARLGLSGRKGSPETFDAAGYVALLRRVVQDDDQMVYAPVFRREIELAEAGALPVAPEVRLVVTEGNYLLLDGPFAPVRDLLDESWYVDIDADVRRDRLLTRHVENGRTREEAKAWVRETDDPNARLIEATRHLADLVVTL